MIKILEVFELKNYFHLTRKKKERKEERKNEKKKNYVATTKIW